MPIADILTPQPGRIAYQESWWIVTPQREVLFFRPNHESPQCNTTREIVEGWLPAFPECTMERLPMVFLKHLCGE